MNDNSLLTLAERLLNCLFEYGKGRRKNYKIRVAYMKELNKTV